MVQTERIATSEAYYYVLDDVTEKGLRFADLNEELASNLEEQND